MAAFIEDEMSKETKSPIKNLPVRVPGQSIDEQIDKVLVKKLLEPLLIAGALCVMAVVEWVRYFLPSKPAPVLNTAIAILGIMWAVWRIRPVIRQLRDLKLGRTGERAVGQYLEEQLRPAGFQVLHDIPGEGFNLDHVVVGPTGVFCIETKTRSKPAKGPCSIQYDGEKVTVDGLAPDRDPVVQAKAAAKWLCELLESSTGKRFFVQPVVLFPGWYIEKMPANTEVWVLNDKATPSFIQGAKTHITAEDASLITFHLKRYVISTDGRDTAKTR
jgi:hypothetical protein